MTREVVLNKSKETLVEITHVLLKVGIKETAIAKIKLALEDERTTYNYLRALLKWITGDVYTCYGEWTKVRRLIPESMWAHYVMMEVEDLQEQILLNKATENLKKAWKTNRPEPERKHKDVSKRNTSKKQQRNSGKAFEGDEPTNPDETGA